MTEIIIARAYGKSTMQLQRLFAQKFHDEYNISYEEALKIVIEAWYSEGEGEGEGE